MTVQNTDSFALQKLPCLPLSRQFLSLFPLLPQLLLVIRLVTRPFTPGFPGKFSTVFCHVQRAVTDLATGAGIGLLNGLAFGRGGGGDVVGKISKCFVVTTQLGSWGLAWQV